MTSPTVLVTRRLPAQVETTLQRVYGATLSTDDHPLGRDELARALCVYDIILSTLTDRLTRDVLSAPDRRTRLLANFGVGTNHIDLAAARELGLAVTNTPGVLTEDTADLTILLMLGVARRVTEGDRELRSGGWTGWRPTHLLGTRIAGKSLGVVGMGRIARAVARRASQGFGMTVRYWSRRRLSRDEESALHVSWCATLPQLLQASDVVSLHCPATPDTFHLINAQALEHMQPHAFLINTSRGDVVDEEALVDALQRGALGGAALDVFEHEPAIPPGLLALPNVVMLPHLGSATLEARVAMGECALRNIAAFVAGHDLPDRVA